MTNSFEVNDDSGVYYSGTYWNDFEIVRDRINCLISGDPTRTWHEHFARETQRTFKRALILNCGNGWVERELVDRGLIAEGVGMDYSQPLIDEATAAARAADLPLTYVQGNVNDAVFPSGNFDLVVNHAAAHHIASLDRVFREICRLLPDDGWFVSMDYVGAHRNQWRFDAWEEVSRLNGDLPPSVRQTLAYPSIDLMLAIDPTEAIHSELILETFHRYFSTAEYTALGGAIAYPILTHNARIFETDDLEEQSRSLERILEADARFLEIHPESTLFAYFAGTPNKSVLRDTESLERWRADEEERERRAREERGGEYYDRGPLSIAQRELLEERVAREDTESRLAQLELELQATRSRLMYVLLSRLIESKWVRAARANQTVAGLETRIRASLLQDAEVPE